MAYCIGMTKTEEIRTLLEREVAQLHQAIGGLMVRIDDLEKQSNRSVDEAFKAHKKHDDLREKFHAQLDEAGLLN